MNVCARCGALLKGRRSQTRYCGGSCRAAASRARAAQSATTPEAVAFPSLDRETAQKPHTAALRERECMVLMARGAWT
jgi:hypothetical protein